MKPFALDTARLRLDSPVAADRARLVEYCQDPSFERYLTLPWPYTEQDADVFLGELLPKWWETDAEYTWALRPEGAGGGVTASPASPDFLGVIGFRLKSRSIGFWLGAEHRGAGLMPEAFTAVARWAFDAGFPKIVWECVVGNLGSASVARGAGFSFGGEKQSAMAYRDGSHPPSWHGVLVPHNLGIVQPGWPDETYAPDSRAS